MSVDIVHSNKYGSWCWDCDNQVVTGCARNESCADCNSLSSHSKKGKRDLGLTYKLLTTEEAAAREEEMAKRKLHGDGSVSNVLGNSTSAKSMVRPRAGEAMASLANALSAVAEAMTIACDMHGGEWEGGRLSAPVSEVSRKCYNSLMRHYFAKAAGNPIDDDPKQGTGCHHDVLIAVNALIAVERRLRDEKHSGVANKA